MFCNDILEIRDGNLENNDGYYSKEVSAIETVKVWKAIHDEDYYI